ncbi:MAG: N-acetyltransferase [Azospirillaceae bacterium]|nr:N-acetyltransferase [Azospirillaceae bacterium]
MPDFPPLSEAGTGFVAGGLRSRRCRPADFPFLQRLYRHSRADELAGTGWSEQDKKRFCEQQFAAQHSDFVHRYPHGDFLLLQRGREPVGRFYVDLSGPVRHVIELTLHPAHRNRGLGTAILGEVQRRAALAGCAMTLSVAFDNPRAEALYRRLGFVETTVAPTRRQMVWTPP